MALSFAKRVERSLDSESPFGLRVRETDRSENARIAIIEVTSSTKWEEDVTARCNKFAGTGFPKYVVVPQKQVGAKAEERVAAWSLEPFCGRAVDEMVASGIENVGA